MEIQHSLFQRKDTKRWVLSVSIDHGPWKQYTAPKELRAAKDAQAWAGAKLAELEATGALFVPSVRAGISVTDLIAKVLKLREEYLTEDKPRVRPGTVNNNRTWSKRIDAAFAGKAASQVGVPEARKFLRETRGTLAANTTRDVYSTAKLIWDIGKAEGWIKVENPWRDPMVQDEVPAGKTVAGKPLTVPLPAMQSLVEDEVIPAVRRVRYCLAFSLGLNDGELAGLQWKSILLDAPVPFLRVIQALAIRGPKGFATLGETKTVNRVRDVPLHPAALAALRWWKSEGWGMHCERSAPRADDFVFVTTTGREYRPKSAARLREDLTRLQLPTEINGHALTFQSARRTFSSVLKSKGVDQEDRGMLMGHAAKSVTEDAYTADDLSYLAGRIALFPIEWRVVRGVVRTAGANAQRAKEVPVMAKENGASTETAKRLAEDPSLCTDTGRDHLSPENLPAERGEGNTSASGNRPRIVTAEDLRTVSPVLARCAGGLAVAMAEWDIYDALQAAEEAS